MEVLRHGGLEQWCLGHRPLMMNSSRPVSVCAAGGCLLNSALVLPLYCLQLPAGVALHTDVPADLAVIGDPDRVIQVQPLPMPFMWI
jgi:hypothetical protein